MFARRPALATATRMARRTAPLERLTMLRRHLSTTTAAEPPVIFQSDRSARIFVLNRPATRNALNTEMIELLQHKLQDWEASNLCGVIIGRGAGIAFCAGGDVKTLVEDVENPETAHKASEFFRKEFQLDLQVAALTVPYVSIMDGITMGGGVGLSMPAQFRVATEKTLFAMPETKIGYFTDVGGSWYLPRLDGELGTYLGLTGNSVSGRDVFKFGLATHFIPSRRVPDLIQRLATLEGEQLRFINRTIEEFYQEPHSDERPTVLQGQIRSALDHAFGFNTVEEIFAALEATKAQSGAVGEWAATTLSELQMRSPTSLRVTLAALRRGRDIEDFYQALAMELQIATAFCNGAGPDFVTGVKSVLVNKDKALPAWNPPTLQGISSQTIEATFFHHDSPFSKGGPVLDTVKNSRNLFLRNSLPTETFVESVVKGTHTTSTPLALTRQEIINDVVKVYDGKHGVREKVEEILDRKTRVLQDPDNQGCLGWIN